MVNNMLLSDRDWKEFYLISDKTFALCEVKTLKSTSSTNYYDKYDVVGATSKNNGNVGFVGTKYNKFLCKGNCICLIKTGQGSVGDAVYKLNDFIPSNNVCIIKSTFLNRYIGNFIVAEINKQADRYSYGYIRNNSRILKEKIMLPVNENNEPDYDFMEAYVKEQEDKKKQAYISFAKKQLENLEYAEVVSLKEKEWKEFFIKDIFTEVQRGKRLTKANQFIGDKPYVSSSAINNGVDNFISNDKNIRTFSDCISLANSGSVGSSFYQPFVFVASDHVTHLKNNKFNKYIYLFIVTLCTRLSDKYNFNREINDKRISKERIILPITIYEQPDYEYMEQYAKNLIIIKLKKYLAFANKK